MTVLRSRVIYFFLLFFSIVPFGCVLEDPVEHGDVCPPGDMRDVNGELYVSFTTLDCYEDYVVLVDVPEGAFELCSECEQKETMLGTVLKCDTVSDECLEQLSQAHHLDYENCGRYRQHNVFDPDNPGKNRISFVRDFEDKDVSLEKAGIGENTRYCPLDFRICRYNDTSEDLPLWFGCFAPCEGDYIYCDGLDGKPTCVNPQANTWHCGAKGTCSDQDANSINWIGSVCVGGICQDGLCQCPEDKGYSSCGDGDGTVCYDIMHDRFHCGVQCITCDDEKVCIDGECKEDFCGKGKNLCHTPEGNCENSDEACGSSCMNCKNILNIATSESAFCNSNTGVCEIKACEAGYHVEQDPNDRTKQVCRPNTETACAPSTNPEGIRVEEFLKDCTKEIDYAEKVICNPNGECEATQCKPGYRLKGIYCEETNCAKVCGEHELCVEGYCRCEPGFTYCGEEIGCVDILNDTEHCGGCEETDACKPDDGIATYKCEFGVCMLDYCIDGYHPYKDDCELSDDLNCGKHENDCSKIENAVEGTGICNEGKCDYECVEGFHVYDGGEKSLCEKNSIENCKEHGKKCFFDNQESAICDNEQGCLVEKCLSGYHVYVNECEINTVDHCKEHDHQCVPNSVCNPDKGCQCADGFNACVKDEEDLCVDFTSDHGHCGKCNHECPEDANCEASQCICTNKSLSYCEDSNSCVDLKNDDLNCGKCGNRCGTDSQCCDGVCTDMTSPNSCGSCTNVCTKKMSCVDKTCQCKENELMCNENCTSIETDTNCGGCGIVCKDGSKCSARTCKCPTAGYGYCDEKCIPLNTKTDCGKCGNNCGADVCYNGNCGCPSGYHVSGNTCEKNTDTNCGAAGNCTTKYSNGIGACSGDACVLKSCNSGYHKNGNQCDKNTDTNCGTDGNCTTKYSNGIGACSGDACVLKSCNSGYHKNGNSCEKNTDTNCGAAGNCTTKYSNGTGGCSGDSCYLKSCNSGYHKNGNNCDKNTDTNCGTDGNCTTKYSNGTGGCSGDACVLKSCNSGYHKNGNSCEKNTDTNCGAAGNCTTKYSNGTGGCSGDSCYLKSCNSGYHKNGNQCEKNTDTNCGAAGNCTTKYSNGTGACSGDSCYLKSCNGGYHKNGDSCEVDNNDHCGNSTTKCTGGKNCINGSCQCPGGQTDCGGTCVYTSSNTSHCGSCNHACTNGMSCISGTCACGSGQLLCGSCTGANIQGAPNVNTDLNIRQSPDVSSASLGTYVLGDKIFIYGYSSSGNSWYRVDGGYVNAAYVYLCHGWGHVVTSSGGLNIRQTINGTILGSIPYGTTNVCINSSSNGWYNISYSKTTGWVSGDYFSVDEWVTYPSSIGHCQN